MTSAARPSACAGVIEKSATMISATVHCSPTVVPAGPRAVNRPAPRAHTAVSSTSSAGCPPTRPPTSVDTDMPQAVRTIARTRVR